MESCSQECLLPAYDKVESKVVKGWLNEGPQHPMQEGGRDPLLLLSSYFKGIRLQDLCTEDESGHTMVSESLSCPPPAIQLSAPARGNGQGRVAPSSLQPPTGGSWNVSPAPFSRPHTDGFFQRYLLQSEMQGVETLIYSHPSSSLILSLSKAFSKL